MKIKQRKIEPGLLYLLQFWIIAAEAVLWLVTMLTDDMFPWYYVRLCVSLLILTYLNIAWLRQRLGTWFLPIALGAYSVLVLASWWMNILHNIQIGKSEETDISLFYQLTIVVFVLAVQYGWRTVASYGLIFLSAVWLLAGQLPESLSELTNSIRYESLWFSLLIASIGVFITYTMSKQRQIQAELNAKNIQLSKYATTVEQLAVSHERNRMARELHDTLAHTLSSVSIQLEAVNRQLDIDIEGARATLKKCRESIKSGLMETRRALKALRVSTLEDLGFMLAVEQLIKLENERNSYDITLQMDEDLGQITPQIEQSLYRIIEESLTNVNRHANAQHVAVKLGYRNNGLELCIHDDGIGFDSGTATESDHYGIKGMHERAILCNGSLNIASQPDSGTTVKLRIEDVR